MNTVRYAMAALLLVMLATLTATAQKNKEVVVEAEIEYIAPNTESPRQAEDKAYEKARIQALADAFHTIVSQTGHTTTVNDGDNSSVSYHAVSTSDTNGEWIEDIEKKCSKRYDPELDMFIYTAYIKGKARKIETTKVNLDVHLLRNGSDIHCEDDTFVDGDQMFLYFKSPISGQLVVYLVDERGEDGDSYRLLPYRQQEGVAYPITHGKEYVFFDHNSPIADKDVTEEYVLTAPDRQEANSLYILFFTKNSKEAKINIARDRSVQGKDLDLPPRLKTTELRDWADKTRKIDPNLVRVMIPFIIKPRQ